MTGKHTPGPWEVFIDDSGGKWTGWPLSIDATSITDKTVVRTGGQFPYKWDAKTSQTEAIANARLIAAAPDLLEALMDAVDAWETHCESGDMMQGDWVCDARAAIAKARGQE